MPDQSTQRKLCTCFCFLQPQYTYTETATTTAQAKLLELVLPMMSRPVNILGSVVDDRNGILPGKSHFLLIPHPVERTMQQQKPRLRYKVIGQSAVKLKRLVR